MDPTEREMPVPDELLEKITQEVLDRMRLSPEDEAAYTGVGPHCRDCTSIGYCARECPERTELLAASGVARVGGSLGMGPVAPDLAQILTPAQVSDGRFGLATHHCVGVRNIQHVPGSDGPVDTQPIDLRHHLPGHGRGLDERFEAKVRAHPLVESGGGHEGLVNPSQAFQQLAVADAERIRVHDLDVVTVVFEHRRGDS